MRLLQPLTPALSPSDGERAGVRGALLPSALALPSMPLYEYELCEGECKVCGGKFTLRRPLSAAPLTKCPACKKPVRKLLSTFNSPRALSISDAKNAGFTVLKKVTKGEYERQ